MKKKLLSLALALIMCLGLTAPIFAAETYTHTYEGITVTAYPNGSISYTGSGKLTKMHAELGIELFFDMRTGVLPISIGQGITITDEFKETWSNFTLKYEIDLSFNDSTPPPQPEQPNEPDAPAYQVSNWAKDRVAVAVETGLAVDGLGNDYRVSITRAQFAATAVKLYEAMSGKKAETTGESSFTDTEDPVILQAADLGFVSGVGDGRFDPSALVTREQAAVMLSNVYAKLGGEIPAVAATSFADDSDVSGWARNAVAFMNSKEIITGVGSNSFSPKGDASIEQALLIALKMFEVLK